MDFPRLHHKTRLCMWSETQLPKSACQVQFDSFTDRTTKNPLKQKICLCNQGSENSSDHLRSAKFALELAANSQRQSGTFYECYRFNIVLLSILKLFIVLQGTDALSFYQGFKYIVANRINLYIVLQRNNHVYTHHALNPPEGNWKWLKSNVTFALCSSLIKHALAARSFPSGTSLFIARVMGSLDLRKDACGDVSALGGWLTSTLLFLLSFCYRFGSYVQDTFCRCGVAAAAAAFGGASDHPAGNEWSFFFGRWGYKKVLLSVHICYWCFRRCWCWDWCGATYSHVNDTASARKWLWSIRTKRYRFFQLFIVLPGFATKQLILQHVSNLSFSSTPATTKFF